MVTEAEHQAAALADFVARGEHRTRCYGDQWGPAPALLRQLVDEWILPALAASTANGESCTALEIGCGGGRWTRHYCDRPGIGLAWLVDATPAAEQAVLAHCDGPLRFVVSQDGNLPEIPDSSVDWVWSFDTFVHFHPELFDRYLREIARVLRPGGPGCKGGLLHLHYAVAWPGLEHNADCFQYRQPEQVADLAYTLGLHRTGRRVEYRSGFGSLLEEFRRVE